MLILGTSSHFPRRRLQGPTRSGLIANLVGEHLAMGVATTVPTSTAQMLIVTALLIGRRAPMPATSLASVSSPAVSAIPLYTWRRSYVKGI